MSSSQENPQETPSRQARVLLMKSVSSPPAHSSETQHAETAIEILSSIDVSPGPSSSPARSKSHSSAGHKLHNFFFNSWHRGRDYFDLILLR